MIPIDEVQIACNTPQLGQNGSRDQKDNDTAVVIQRKGREPHQTIASAGTRPPALQLRASEDAPPAGYAISMTCRSLGHVRN